MSLAWSTGCGMPSGDLPADVLACWRCCVEVGPEGHWGRTGAGGDGEGASDCWLVDCSPHESWGGSSHEHGGWVWANGLVSRRARLGDVESLHSCSEGSCLIRWLGTVILKDARICVI
jgi:hypothetical protein